METILIVIDSDAELARARALVDRLMESDRPEDLARLAAQARLIAAYEEEKWPPRAPSPRRGDPLSDGPARAEAGRSPAAAGERRAGR